MEHSTEAQEAQILAALKRGEALTPMDALRRFGCFRLGARIFDLRRKGHPVTTDMITDEATNKRFAEYRMKKDTTQ